MNNLHRFGALLLSLVTGFAHGQALTPQQQRARAPQPVQVQSELSKKLAGVSDVKQLLAAARKFEAASEWRNLQDVYERIVQLQPNAGNIKYELAATYALQDEKRKAYDALINLQVQGYAYDPSEDSRFDKVKTTPVYEYILKNLAANRVPFGEGGVAFTLPKGDHLYESMAFDAAAKQFLVGSVRDGSISRVGLDGKITPFIEASAANGLWAITDLAIDATRKHLWVASTGLPHFRKIAETDFGAGGVFQFDLVTGKLITKHVLPIEGRPYILSSIAVSSKGDVFAADDAARRIFRVEKTGLRMFVSNPKLTSIRSLAFSGNGELLYFSDYDLGIFGIRLTDQKAFPLVPTKNLTLMGIESMTEWNGHLVIVQNAFPPARVMRLKLHDSGTAIVQAAPVSAGQPEFTGPTQGAVVGTDFYLISNSQKGQYDQYGIPRDAAKLEAVRVFKANLDVKVDPRGGQVRPLGT